MTSKHKYVGGSILVALLGIGIVIYLVRRKPEINVTGVIEAGAPTVTFKTWNDSAPAESDVTRMIRISDAAIAADEMEQKL